jgi:DUF1680 family protein
MHLRLLPLLLVALPCASSSQPAAWQQAASSTVKSQPTSSRTASPQAGHADYPIQAVPATRVRLTDEFWRPRLETNRTVTIPHILKQNELTGRVANFLKAARRQTGSYEGQRYNDTDVYKIIEAASYSLAARPDAALEKQLDDLIAIVAAAQEPDGYLYTPRSVDPAHPAPGAGPERWSWLHTSHELYDQGHMFEAAVAHFQATGKRTLLDVAIRSADLICATFGPAARRDAPGHQEIELALVKLYRVTGTQAYLDTARFFLDERGRPHSVTHPTFAKGDRFFMYNDLAYRQDHKPVLEQERAEGHAVRAVYMLAGMMDVGTLMAEQAYTRRAEALFQDVVSKRMYVTGGLGAKGQTEAFDDDYVLPNRAYAETCASIGGMLWYHRMFLREGDASYMDVFERTLYNGYLSGVSLAGDTFFYQNPLVSTGKVERSAYFDVACCPANLARLMAQLPGLVFARRDDVIFVNLFVGSEARVEMQDGAWRIAQQTRYPWNGRVSIRIDPATASPAEATLALRIPGWSRGEAMPTDLYRFADAGSVTQTPTRGGTPLTTPTPTLTVNGKAEPIVLEKGFARIQRRWQKGDVVELDLPMPVQRLVAHASVAEDRGKIALQRGPVVYCFEGIDNGGAIDTAAVPASATLTHAFRRDLLNGVEVITARASAKDAPDGSAAPGDAGAPRERTLVAVPYFAWANRGKGAMAVWIAGGQ